MKRDQRSNRVRYHGGRPPPGEVLAPCVKNGTDGALPHADHRHPGYAGLPGGETKEVGLTLTPPSRFRSLLVPLDGSAFGEHALPLALGIARRAGASVRLAHVLVQHGALLRRRSQAYLEGLARRLTEVARVPVVPLLAEGRDVATALCGAASEATDLVVMATHGRGPLGRFCFDGTADALMRRLSVPLLLVRGHDTPADLTGEPHVRHILIPLNGSGFAEKVLLPAIGLGALTGAQHTLLRVIPSGTDYPLVYGGDVAQLQLTARRETEAWEYLREVTKRLGCQSVPIQTQTIFSGQAIGREILYYAERYDADLIALTIRDRSGLSRLFRAGVADRVVRGASVPVLVYRPDAEQGRCNRPETRERTERSGDAGSASPIQGLTGRVRTEDARQFTQHAVTGATDAPILRNEIEVS